MWILPVPSAKGRGSTSKYSTPTSLYVTQNHQIISRLSQNTFQSINQIFHYKSLSVVRQYFHTKLTVHQTDLFNQIWQTHKILSYVYKQREMTFTQ